MLGRCLYEYESGDRFSFNLPLDRSAALLGTISLANALPMIFISIFGGAIADRVQKTALMVGLFVRPY